MIADPERYAIANQILSWSSMPGYEEVISGVRERVDKLERAAVAVPATADNATARWAMIAWQEARASLMIIEDQISRAREYIATEKEEETNAGTDGNSY